MRHTCLGTDARTMATPYAAGPYTLEFGVVMITTRIGEYESGYTSCHKHRCTEKHQRTRCDRAAHTQLRLDRVAHTQLCHRTTWATELPVGNSVACRLLVSRNTSMVAAQLGSGNTIFMLWRYLFPFRGSAWATIAA